MKPNRLGKALISTLLMTACALPFSVQADSPDNLDIMWCRANLQKTPFYKQKSVNSGTVKYLEKNDLVYIASRETDNTGNGWFEVVWPFKGWMREKDSWFPYNRTYNPNNLPIYERMSIRLATDIGNYPKATIKKLGQPKKQEYAVQNFAGRVVVQTLTWKGMVIEYMNSYRKEEDAWINRIAAGPGAKISFGPIRVGDSSAKLVEYGISQGEPLIHGEVRLEEGAEKFLFIIRENRVASMHYQFGNDGYLWLP